MPWAETAREEETKVTLAGGSFKQVTWEVHGYSWGFYKEECHRFRSCWGGACRKGEAANSEGRGQASPMATSMTEIQSGEKALESKWTPGVEKDHTKGQAPL